MVWSEFCFAYFFVSLHEESGIKNVKFSVFFRREIQLHSAISKIGINTNSTAKLA